MGKEEKARELHASSIIIDGLVISRWTEDFFVRLRQGGLTAINATLATHDEGFREVTRRFARWYQMFEEYHSLIMPVTRVEDIRRAKELGKTGIIFGFQDTTPIEDELDYLSIYHRLGVRVIQLTYMEANYVGDGCLEKRNGGLTSFGFEVIEELNRLGILIDLSHVGYKTTMEAIEASKMPVAFTHANPKGLCDHPRNKTDEQIKAVAAKGGVIGANIFPLFLAGGSKSTMKDLIDVVDYMANLVGIDRIGIGTDFTEGQPIEFFEYLLKGKSKKGPTFELEYPIVFPEGIRSISEFPNITKALAERGYTEPDVKKVMGENFLRLFGKVWEKNETEIR